MHTLRDIELLGPKKEQDYSNFIWNNKENVVYGPVDSRRLGHSLGINLFPDGKVCEFRCVYCDCDLSPSTNSVASLDRILDEIENGLREHKDKGSSIDYITFAGNGEPTAYPWFPKVVQAVNAFRSLLFPNIPLAIFTNCMNLARVEIQNVLIEIDEVFFKIDAADQDTFHRLNRPIHDTNIADIASQIAKFKHPKISTAVIKHPEIMSNFRSLLSDDFVNLLRSVDASALYLYSIDYPTHTISVAPVSEEELFALARRIQETESIPIRVLTTTPIKDKVVNHG